jgi:YVTN family beta-propeller protein
MLDCLRPRLRVSHALAASFVFSLATQALHAETLLPRLRRPVALQLSADESVLYTANQRSGSISQVDLAERRATGEFTVGQRLSDLVAVNSRNLLLATDESAHELLLLETGNKALKVRQRVPVSPYPVSLAVNSSGRLCVVASLWSRRLTFVQLPDDASREARVLGSLDLPFAPRCQLFLRQDRRLLVADAFRDRFAIVDPDCRELLHLRTFPAHNIRGLALKPNSELLGFAHQMLNDLAHTNYNDVHWGILLSNDLRWVRREAILDKEQNLYKGGHMQPLGHAGDATGDPSDFLVTADGTVVVALGGVGEIAFGKSDEYTLLRLSVGKRPTALASSRDGKRVYVANTFSDSVSIVHLADHEVVAEISLGPQAKLSLADRGELLFYDASLSHDRWMSCHSCHTDGHSNGLLTDNLSDESFGAPKRVFSLLGRSGTEPFSWTGNSQTLAEQIKKSITKTMQADAPPTEDQVAALAAFVKTLQPPPPLEQLQGTVDPAAIDRGRDVFAAQGCHDCHAPPAYTTPDTYDVDLEDKVGNRLFNPPSLRGVGHRAPLLHDNRAETLEDVFLVVGHQLDEALPEEQLKDLLAFLRSL